MARRDDALEPEGGRLDEHVHALGRQGARQAVEEVAHRPSVPRGSALGGRAAVMSECEGHAMSHDVYQTLTARRSPWVGWVAAAVAVIAVAAFTGGFVAARYEARLGQMARETIRIREQLQRDVAVLRDQIGVYRSAVELLRDPATQVVSLRGLGPSAAATGRVVWHAVAGGHLVVANLPRAPEGKAYELWTIGEGAPQPAGLFQVDAQGRGSRRVEPVAGGAPVKVFAVTLEPEGGVPAPTGPMVLASAK
ncbi:MAG: anti-sigma factor [Candidatus Rokubacteria bacterium]|nr:anti-sigma factor [Candidatus Rokubacteria bacterium]